MNKKIFLAVSLAAIFLVIAGIFAGIAHAETIPTGGIYVKVINEDGKVIQNATVELISNSSQIIATGETNKTGEILFSGSMANFTGIIKITADGYKDKSIDITYNNTKAYAYTAILQSTGYINKAKNIYEQHKMAVIAGGAVIFFILLLLVIGRKRIRW